MQRVADEIIFPRHRLIGRAKVEGDRTAEPDHAVDFRSGRRDQPPGLGLRLGNEETGAIADIRARQIGVGCGVGGRVGMREKRGLHLRIGHYHPFGAAFAKVACGKALARDLSPADVNVYSDVIGYQTIKILHAIGHGRKKRRRRVGRAGIINKIYLHCPAPIAQSLLIAHRRPIDTQNARGYLKSG